jgi:metal-sulfur cluster biosynthetic enzyme
MVTVDKVRDALKDVYDPEIPVNVVDLGLIYNIEVYDENRVQVEMTLTSAGCSMGPFIAQQAEWAIDAVDGVEAVEVNISFDPPWNPDNISADGRLLLGIDD